MSRLAPSGPTGCRRYSKLKGFFSKLLKVRGSQASSFRDSRQHFRSNLLIVVKCEHEIWPVGPSQRSMRTGLTLDLPADPLEGHQHAPGFGGRPVAQAA
jgi:hypothetical protein